MTCNEKYVCPFCGAKGYRNVGEIIAYSVDFSGNTLWQLVICDECGGSYQISFKIDPESVQIKPELPGEEED